MSLIEHLRHVLPSISETVPNLFSKSPVEKAGPCPRCGGRDRFVTWTDKDRFWCRQCDWRGDRITLHCHLQNVTVKELCKRHVGRGVKIDYSAIEEKRHKSELKRAFHKWIGAAIDDLRILINSTFKVVAGWQNADDFYSSAELLGPVARWQYIQGILADGTDRDRWEVYQEWKGAGQTF